MWRANKRWDFIELYCCRLYGCGHALPSIYLAQNPVLNRMCVHLFPFFLSLFLSFSVFVPSLARSCPVSFSLSICAHIYANGIHNNFSVGFSRVPKKKYNYANEAKHESKKKGKKNLFNSDEQRAEELQVWTRPLNANGVRMSTKTRKSKWKFEAKATDRQKRSSSIQPLLTTIRCH